MGGGKQIQEGGDILIHVSVWQNPIQYCKAIILQLKINFKKCISIKKIIPLKNILDLAMVFS